MLRPRTRSRRKLRAVQPATAEPGVHPLGTPTGGVSPNTGPLASASWLADLELIPVEARWYVEIALDSIDDRGQARARFHLDVYSEEWGFRYVHGDLASWIRVTDIPFVHGRDDHALLSQTPKLRAVSQLLREIETTHGVTFARQPAELRTNVPDAEAKIHDWIARL